MMNFIHWCAANKALIVTLLVAIGHVFTILNSIVPEEKGPAWLHKLLGRLATLDKDGNLSIPIVQGNAPSAAPMPLPPAALILVLAGALLSSCAAMKQVAIDTGECAAVDVAGVLGPVVSLLTSDQSDASVQSGLQNIGVQYGQAVLSCALQAAIKDLFGGLKTAKSADPKTIRAIRRAQAYLSLVKK